MPHCHPPLRAEAYLLRQSGPECEGQFIPHSFPALKLTEGIRANAKSADHRPDRLCGNLGRGIRRLGNQSASATLSNAFSIAKVPFRRSRSLVETGAPISFFVLSITAERRKK